MRTVSKKSDRSSIGSIGLFLSGILIFFSVLTYLPGWISGKDFEGVLLPIWSVLLLPLLLISWPSNVRATRRLWVMSLLLMIYILRAFNGNVELKLLLLDSLGLILMLPVFLISRRLTNKDLLKLRFFFLLSCAVSLLIILYMRSNYSVFRESNYFRSFGTQLGNVEFRRIVTSTYIPSMVYVTWVLLKRFYVGKFDSRSEIFGLFVCGTILTIAATRGSIIYIVCAFIFTFLISHDKRKYKSLLYFMPVLITAFLVSLLYGNRRTSAELNWISLFLNRFSSSVEGERYRLTEFETSKISFFESPLFGIGLGSKHRPYSTIWSNSWLEEYGDLYLHNTWLWLLVKFGIFGVGILLTLLLGGKNRQYANSLNDQKIVKALLLAFIPFSFFWNVLVNLPDAIVIAALLGIYTRQSTRKETSIYGETV